MKQITDKQKELLLDYAMGMTGGDELIEAEKLIESSDEAAQLFAQLKASFSPLDSIELDYCPDELVEGTVWRLKNAARASQLELEHLLQKEQERAVPTRSFFWRNLGQMVSMAAGIILISGVLIAPLKHARALSWQQACQFQLKRIWQGIQNYSADHDGQLPAVATSAGSPWWKVGYQGQENHSNTRHIWLLAKEGYVSPKDFVCPARRQGRMLQFSDDDVQKYNDFPARRYVTYSFRVKGNSSGVAKILGEQVLIADMNPIFENLPRDFSGHLKLKIDKELLNRNSSNHNCRGQNVLFRDGSVNFSRERRVGVAADDIFTLKNTELYQGVEVPSCVTDAFLAP